ncbi:hypothetical protein ZEAMMB73_Zm00001d021028 [Zea mays]|uniref:Uncharacterized protein n=1 Tax=Zea mays TaxID=4577 RepID=A0A1D6I800_MAIZE|nr:hypothetical protein ZEAMMB73_Zm00001d021028 [Zea mays]ONM56173.1 hypothetical protein ZEAMMB73_Zm00001d021028 [Zea mays]
MGHGPASDDDDDGDDGSSSKASHTQLMRCSCSALAMHDSGGRLQKHVLLKRDNGDVVSFSSPSISDT